MGISLTELTGQIRSRIPGAAGSRPTLRGLPSAMGLEIDGLTLRIAEASRSGNSNRIDQVRALPLELPENADRADASVLGTAIAKTLAKARIKPGPVVLGIGRSQVILRTVVVPDTGLTGTIAALEVEVGEQLAPRAPVIQLGDLAAWQLETDDLIELDMVRVQPGAPVAVTVDALPGVELSGTVVRVKPIGEDKIGDMTYTAYIALGEQAAGLAWNMTATVYIGGVE